jgi:glucokinase
LIETEVELTTPASESAENVIRDLVFGIKQVIDNEVTGIGIGVPGLVDEENGIVYSVQNIQSWNKVHLKKHIEDQFKKSVCLTNDANCFALGEKLYGKGKPFKNIVGMTLGTGFGAGIIINDKLYSGNLSIAGELGGIPYLQSDYEQYCSNKFFTNFFNLQGREVYERALNGNIQALNIFEQFGKHLSSVVQLVLYALGPDAIIFGGSVSKSFPFFKESLWNDLQRFPYKSILDRLVIDVSETDKVAVLGAASLSHQKNNKPQKKLSAIEIH